MAGCLLWSVGSPAACHSATFVVSNPYDSGAGSLRQRILEANSSHESSTISFEILPASPNYVISLLSPLPQVTVPLVIDGRSQPGYFGSPIIELEGTAAGTANGLTLMAGSSMVRGLAITTFSLNGIELHGANNSVSGNYIGLHLDGSSRGGNLLSGIVVTADSSHNVIGVGGTNVEDRNVISGNLHHGIALNDTFGPGADQNSIFGNYIGTSATGDMALGNGLDGIFVDSPGNIIGGAAMPRRNVISANGGQGIELAILSHDSTIQGNYIGTDRNGSVALGNTLGIRSISPNSLIGGPSAGEGNLISGNRTDGIVLSYEEGGWLAHDNVIQGNYIGTDASGAAPVGNLRHGITTDRVYGQNQIGGTGPWPMGNVIAFNGGAGITVNNQTLGNSIHDNGLLGIDFAGGTPVLNDPGDTDHYQNYPIIHAAIVRSSSTDFYVEFSSRPNTPYRLEFFLSAHCDPSGFGEGAILIFVVNITTDAMGDGGFTTTFPFALPEGCVMTATATSPDGNTSEFSPCAHVYSRDYLTITHVVRRPGEGDGAMTMEMAREPGGAEINVKYRTISGTAKEGRNFLPASGLVTLDQGQTNAFFKVQLVDNDLIEGPKSFQVQLSNPTNSLEIWSTAYVVIEDNDGPLNLDLCVRSNAPALRWTTNAVGYELQSAPALDNSVPWETITNPPKLEGTNWYVIDSITGSSRYYRLRQK